MNDYAAHFVLAKAYQDVIDRAGNKLIGQTARLGLAAAQARSGQYDQAITAYKELAQRKDAELPIDGILMELGRVYRDAGRGSDAQQTFNRWSRNFRTRRSMRTRSANWKR